MKIRKILLLFIFTASILNAQSYYYNNHKKITLTPLQNSQSSENRSVSNPNGILYFQSDSKVLGVSDEIILKCLDIDKILSSYDVTLVKQISKEIYLVKVKQSSLTLEMANKLYEDQDVVYAHPNFIQTIEKR